MTRLESLGSFRADKALSIFLRLVNDLFITFQVLLFVRKFYCAGNTTVICHTLLQALVKILWRQKRRGKNSRSAKEWHIYFQFNTKCLRERTGRLEKVANRVVAESFENSRKVSFSQRRCVNVMGLFFFFFMFLLRYELISSK